jgi:hypothetical protein
MDRNARIRRVPDPLRVGIERDAGLLDHPLPEGNPGDDLPLEGVVREEEILERVAEVLLDRVGVISLVVYRDRTDSFAAEERESRYELVDVPLPRPGSPHRIDVVEDVSESGAVRRVIGEIDRIIAAGLAVVSRPRVVDPALSVQVAGEEMLAPAVHRVPIHIHMRLLEPEMHALVMPQRKADAFPHWLPVRRELHRLDHVL